MNPNPYMPVPAEIEEVRKETPNIKTFRLRPEREVAFEAGQFIELSVPGAGEAPFTPSSSPADGERMEVTVMETGRVTGLLHGMKRGGAVGIRGPLGRPYPLKDFRKREILIVGGGVGLAPLRALLFALALDKKKFGRIILRYGARTARDLVYRKDLLNGWEGEMADDLLLTVDKAGKTWQGHEGVVTTILEPDRLKCNPGKGVAVVCGPPVMMKFTTLKLLGLGYPPDSIYLSMEKNMSCGIGKCGHCRLGTHYACRDGPVFTYAQVRNEAKIWD